MPFALDLYTTADWGDGPTFQSGYIYSNTEQALNDGVELFHRWAAAGTPLDVLGFEVISQERDEWDSPVVEETFTARRLGLL